MMTTFLEYATIFAIITFPKNPLWERPERVLGLLAAAAVVWHCWSSRYDHDEIQHLHAAWLISQGLLPFRDFLENHHPTLAWLAAPVVARFSSVPRLVFAARLFDAACLLALFGVVARLLKRAAPDAPPRLPVLPLLASFMLARVMLEFRPDPLMHILAYGGVLQWVAYLQGGRWRRALAAGLLFGLAVVVLQKALVILGLIAASALLLAALRLKSRAPAGSILLGAAVALAAASAPIAAMFCALRAAGLLKDFWFWCYDFNRFVYLHADFPWWPTFLRAVGRTSAADPLLWAFGAWGGWLSVRAALRRKRLSPHDEVRLTLALLALGTFVFACLSRIPLDQYFIAPLPCLALLAPEALKAVRGERTRRLTRLAIVCTPVALIALLLAYPDNGEQRWVQDYLLARAAPDQPVFAPPPYNPVFRRDGAYFWFNGALFSAVYANLCAREGGCPNDKLALDEALWQKSPPAYVLLGPPAIAPYRWGARRAAYQRTRIVQLWERVRAR